MDKLRSVLKEYQQKAAASVSTPGVQKRAVTEVGLEWLDVAMETLREWAPKREDIAHCVRHGRPCPAFPPRASVSTPGRFHFEIDGVIGQPWSMIG